jgi:ribonuclease-3
LIVTEELYLKYPDLDESRLSPLRSGIVNMRALADIARTLELGKYIRLGKGEEVTNGRDKNSLLADALEALIGAIYLECGFEKSTAVVRGLIKDTLENAMAKGAGLDGKTALQELVAAQGKGSPEYLVSESGPDHDKNFIAVAMVAGSAISEGSGKSKREAEQSAARSAFELLSQSNS